MAPATVNVVHAQAIKYYFKPLFVYSNYQEPTIKKRLSRKITWRYFSR